MSGPPAWAAMEARSASRVPAAMFGFISHVTVIPGYFSLNPAMTDSNALSADGQAQTVIEAWRFADESAAKAAPAPAVATRTTAMTRNFNFPIVLLLTDEDLFRRPHAGPPVKDR